MRRIGSTKKRCAKSSASRPSRFAPIADERELEAAIATVGLPAVLKTRRLGYDGKGQRIVRHASEAAVAWQSLGSVPSILESFVDFTRELSIIAVRGSDGQIGYYPLIENHHAEGILRLSLAPAPRTSSELQAAAEAAIKKLLDHFDYVGVLALELFETPGRPARQRDRAACPQLGPLDDRRRRDQPVREPHPRDHRASAWDRPLRSATAR